MKAISIALSACLCCTIINAPAAQAKRQTVPVLHQSNPHRAISYRLTQIRLADSIPPKYVWVIYDRKGNLVGPDYDEKGGHVTGMDGAGAVYASLDSPALRQWVGYLPVGSTITTAVGMGQSFSIQLAPKQAVTRDPDEWGVPGLEEFAHFCRGKGIHFVIYGVSD